MTKILITFDWFLPGSNAGGPVRSIFNLVKSFPEFQFYIVTSNRDYCSDVPYSGITSNTWIKLLNNCNVYYSSRLTKSELIYLITDVNPYLVYVNGIFSKRYSIWPISIATYLRYPIIVAPRGMLSHQSLSVKSFKKFPFIWLMRFFGFYSNVIFHVTSEHEEADVKRLFPFNFGVCFIPNISMPPFDSISILDKHIDSLKAVYLGRIAPEKGTLEAIDSLKYVSGSIDLYIYGACYNTVYWQKCLSKIQELPSNSRVHYGGTILVDSQMYFDVLNQSHILLLPSLGENYGHSIVECLSFGKPVIIGKNTPWRNLSAHFAGFDVESKDISQCLKYFLSLNHSEYQKWCYGALNYYKFQIQSSKKRDLDKYRLLFSSYEVS